jgi:hypothetical protein
MPPAGARTHAELNRKEYGQLLAHVHTHSNTHARAHTLTKLLYVHFNNTVDAGR